MGVYDFFYILKCLRKQQYLAEKWIRRSNWQRFFNFLKYITDKNYGKKFKFWDWIIIPWELNILKSLSISQISLST